MVAALNGHALGGGAEFAVAADIRVAADDIKIGFNQVALAIMPAWGGAERLAALVGYSKALLLAGTGRDPRRRRGRAHRAGRPGVCRALRSTSNGGRSRRSLATAPAGQVKRVMRGVPTTEAVAAFARLWVSDEHWAAADKIVKKSK